jgi:transposase-like protein
MGTQHYSKQFKEAIIKKLNQSELSLRQFAKQESMNPSTLYKWKEEFKISGSSVSKEIRPEQWSGEEKFAVVLETATLSEIEISEYGRSKGLYPEQINAWKQACIAGNARQAGNNKAIQAANKSDKKRIKELEKELGRKEKALAETAALLVLRKKFNAYWGEDEDN